MAFNNGMYCPRKNNCIVWLGCLGDFHCFNLAWFCYFVVKKEPLHIGIKKIFLNIFLMLFICTVYNVYNQI